MKKAIELTLIILFAAGLFAIAGYTIFGPQDTVSYYEQRPLKPIPKPTLTALWTGEYFTDLEAAYTDHIALRNTMLKLHTKAEMGMGKVTVNGVTAGTKELLDYNGFLRWGLTEVPGQASEMAEGYASLQKKIQANGGYFCYLGLPLQSTYFAESYPACLDNRQWQMSAVRETFGEEMEARGVPFLDMYKVYEAEGFPKEYYYETDHHYTMRGAYAAYEALMGKLSQESGYELKTYKKEDYNWTTIPNRFLGSANRKLYGLKETADTLEIAEGPEIPFQRYDNGQPVEATVYSVPEQEWEPATYSVYMNGDIGETAIQTNRPELPSALIYGDSFTNPLESLLWQSFDETRSLDFRYYDEKTLTEYLDEYKPEIVICIRDETVYLSPEGNGTTE